MLSPVLSRRHAPTLTTTALAVVMLAGTPGPTGAAQGAQRQEVPATAGVAHSRPSDSRSAAGRGHGGNLLAMARVAGRRSKTSATRRTTLARAATAPKKKHRPAPRKEALSQRRVPTTKGGFPNVQALGALVLDENGQELYARNADRERPIASISKLAATLAVVDRGLNLDGLSTITRSDLDVARGGARSRLLEGMTLSNRDLLHAALMGSDNRAIPALGRAVKLSPAELAAAMTAKAKKLGLSKTRFRDPTGLSMENVSTPRETIALLRAVMQSPVLGPITQRVQYDAHPIGKPPIRYINTHRPATRGNVQVLGGKTGYNDDARYCLVLAAKIDGHTCFMSFLSNEGKLTRFGDVARVADWMVHRKPKGHPSTATAAATAVAVGSEPPAPWSPPVPWAPPAPWSPVLPEPPPSQTSAADTTAPTSPSPFGGASSEAEPEGPTTTESLLAPVAPTEAPGSAAPTVMAPVGP